MKRIDGFDGPRDGEFSEFHRVLTADEVPSANTPWWQVAEFALSFDGYAALGVGRVGDLANSAAEAWLRDGSLPTDLALLRGCLFFEQRRYHHFGTPPDDEGMTYLRALVEAIRAAAERQEPVQPDQRPVAIGWTTPQEHD